MDNFSRHTWLGWYGNGLLCHTETLPLLPSPPRPTNHQSLLVCKIIVIFTNRLLLSKVIVCIYITPE